MSKRTLRFVIIVAIQLVILAVIIFFPEGVKRRLFSDYEEASRPGITMHLLEDQSDETVRAIDHAGLFERYRWTRAVGVETPGQALLVLPDGNFSQYWHFESFLVSAHEASLGALILDLKDVAEFVPLEAPDGSFRTTGERMQIFTDAARRWLIGLGFSEITLVSFGIGTLSALEIIEQSPPGSFAAWVDVSGSTSKANWLLASSSQTTWPPVLLITGANDGSLADRRAFAADLSRQGVRIKHDIVDSAGPMLLGEDGELDREVENSVIQEVFDWPRR